MITDENKKYLYDFVKNYLDGAAGLFDKDPASSDFSRGYQKALISLKDILDRIESSYEKDSLTSN